MTVLGDTGRASLSRENMLWLGRRSSGRLGAGNMGGRGVERPIGQVSKGIVAGDCLGETPGDRCGGLARVSLTLVPLGRTNVPVDRSSWISR